MQHAHAFFLFPCNMYGYSNISPRFCMWLPLSPSLHFFLNPFLFPPPPSYFPPSLPPFLLSLRMGSSTQQTPLYGISQHCVWRSFLCGPSSRPPRNSRRKAPSIPSLSWSDCTALPPTPAQQRGWVLPSLSTVSTLCSGQNEAAKLVCQNYILLVREKKGWKYNYHIFLISILGEM